MKIFFTLLIIIISLTAFSRTVIPAGLVPNNKIDATPPAIALQPLSKAHAHAGNNGISISNLGHLHMQMENKYEVMSLNSASPARK